MNEFELGWVKSKLLSSSKEGTQGHFSSTIIIGKPRLQEKI